MCRQLTDRTARAEHNQLDHALVEQSIAIVKRRQWIKRLAIEYRRVGLPHNINPSDAADASLIYVAVGAKCSDNRQESYRYANKREFCDWAGGVMSATFHHKPSIEIDLESLNDDPYPWFERMRKIGPVIWVEPLKMWYVVGYQEVRKILMDDVHFSTGTDHSLIYDTFGSNMLTQNGDAHLRARKTFRNAFSPAAIRKSMTDNVEEIADGLIDNFRDKGEIDLRSAFASRLPILAVLKLFGFDTDQEIHLRKWYNSFEKALANFTWDAKVRAEAKQAVSEFHALFRKQIEAVRISPGTDLLSQVVHDDGQDPLSDEELILNASIIFFGGISTVEALVLNTLYASAVAKIDLHADDLKTLDAAIEEAIRWLSPVQSATRHVLMDVEINGVWFAPGEAVNCMLGAANRDPSIFSHPDRYDPTRQDVSRHLSFATDVLP
jgi:cytochrome P450